MNKLIARLKFHPRFFAYATVLVAFFLRCFRLADKNVWWDEGWSIWLSQKDLAWIALRTAADEHPPLHYWLLHFWNFIAGTDAFAGRFVSVFFGVLTIALMYRIGKRVGSAWVGVLAALFLAIARFHIWWSQDIKNYTPSIFFAFAAVWFAIQITDYRLQITDWKPSVSQFADRNSIIGYALCAALALWTHYLAALVLIALNLYALIVILKNLKSNRRWLIGSLVNWLIADALAALLFIPWLYLYLQNASSWSAAPTFDFALFLKLVATVLPLGVTTNIDNYATVTIVLTMIALIGCIRVFAPRHSRFSVPRGAGRGALFILIVLVPPALIYLLSLTPVSFFAPKIQARYLLVLLPAYVMLLALGVAFLSRLSRYFAAFAILGILAASVFVLNDYYAERRLTDDYATLANTINSFARQGDLVLLDTDQEWPTFLYYLRAPIDWLGASNGKPMDDGTADALVRRALNRNDAVWLVTIPDALATDPQHLLENRLARELSIQYQRIVDDKRLVLYASAPRGFVAVAHENFSPQYSRADQVDMNTQLVGFDLPTRELNAGDTLRLITYWHAANPAMVSVRLSNLITTTLQMPSGDLLRYETDFAIPPDVSGAFAVAVNQIDLARVTIAPRNMISSTKNIPHPTDYRLGDSVHLVGYDLPITNYHPGDNVPLTLHWRTDRTIDKSYTAFVHLVGAQWNPVSNNPLWGQVDRAPSPPTNAWLSNETVSDAYSVRIDPNAPPGKYQIEIGMYDAATGARLSTESGNSVIIAEIEIAP